MNQGVNAGGAEVKGRLCFETAAGKWGGVMVEKLKQKNLACI
jgi:hypothetical protein